MAPSWPQSPSNLAGDWLQDNVYSHAKDFIWRWFGRFIFSRRHLISIINCHENKKIDWENLSIISCPQLPCLY